MNKNPENKCVLKGSHGSRQALCSQGSKPNNSTATIKNTLPADSKVLIKVYDILGRKAKTLIKEIKKAGFSRESFGWRKASGVHPFHI